LRGKPVRDLTKLVYPFPQKVVHTNPSGGGDYVSHWVVEQRLLDVLGTVNTELVHTVHGDVASKKEGQPGLTGACVAVILRMTVNIDGREVVVEEVGDCEDPLFWKTDGARLKDAFSDAYKRCAMRLGVGLHLWARDEFYLFDKLKKHDEDAEAEQAEPKETWPLSQADAKERLTNIFAKAGASAPAEESVDLLKAMGAGDTLTAREWAAIANAADDVIKAYA
jgi:hypothetical protein